ncbi:MAG: MBL fold metallo-hydrolase [Actinomycetia bacterium]|nr:MBL fold metallo-hydrolase [Actinomycetes bacterium]
MTPVLTQVTERVHLVQTDLVNWTIVTADTGVMLIDAGFPGSRDDVLTSLRTLGYSPADVRAILLTHAHIDHLGSAIWLARTHDTPVYCHAGEVGHAKREYLQQVSPAALISQAWRPRWLAWSLQVARRGGLVRDGIPGTGALTEDIAAGLPGRPVPVPTPGHTSGHCSYLVDGVLVAGDALITGHPLARHSGPQLLPSMFNHSDPDCRRSLEALSATGAGMLIPGHGELWVGPIAEAVRRATA